MAIFPNLIHRFNEISIKSYLNFCTDECIFNVYVYEDIFISQWFSNIFWVRTVCSLKNRDLQRALFYVFNICQHWKCLHTNSLKDKKLFMHKWHFLLKISKLKNNIENDDIFNFIWTETFITNNRLIQLMHSICCDMLFWLSRWRQVDLYQKYNWRRMERMKILSLFRFWGYSSLIGHLTS